jgi:hypothetical protein
MIKTMNLLDYKANIVNNVVNLSVWTGKLPLAGGLQRPTMPGI